MPAAAADVPTAVVTVTFTIPAAPAGAVAVIEVAELTTTFVAELVPNLTVAPLMKPVPVSVTTLPPAAGPRVGLVALTVGTVPTTKLVALVAVPPVPITRMRPVVAPRGTLVLRVVSDRTLRPAETPLKVMPVTVRKSVPVTVTVVPTGPKAGLKPVIVGAAVKRLKLPGTVTVPAGLVTVSTPDATPAGVTAVIFASDTMVKLAAATPLNCTLLTYERFDPLRVTVVPPPPDVGLKLLRLGRAVNCATTDAPVPLKVSEHAGFEPEQPEVHPTKPLPSLGTARRATVPGSRAAKHEDPQSIPAGVDITVPEPVVDTARRPEVELPKTAVAVRAAAIDRVQVVDVPEQAPPQPLKDCPSAGVDVSTTDVAGSNVASQVAPQLMPPEFEVTVPRPDFVTARTFDVEVPQRVAIERDDDIGTEHWTVL
ncbi:unannotated protein [freshwater metagenome]|uniref:Unannotated protein n=1 Tax=freshwater metagenome TaxID=449393 RepID=A0A6J7PJG4_9ZZZZ